MLKKKKKIGLVYLLLHKCQIRAGRRVPERKKLARQICQFGNSKKPHRTPFAWTSFLYLQFPCRHKTDGDTFWTLHRTEGWNFHLGCVGLRVLCTLQKQLLKYCSKIPVHSILKCLSGLTATIQWHTCAQLNAFKHSSVPLYWHTH